MIHLIVKTGVYIYIYAVRVTHVLILWLKVITGGGVMMWDDTEETR